MDNRIKFNLQFKIIILVVLVVFTVTFILMLYDLSRENDFLQERIRGNAVILASTFNVIISTFEDLENHQRIQENIYRFLILYPGLTNISVSTLNNEGLVEIIASSNTDQIGQQFELEEELKSNVVILEDSEFLNIITPIIIDGQRVGFYSMYFSLESVNIFISQRKKEVFWVIFFSVLLISMALFYFLKKIIITPVFKIEEGLKLIGEGDLNHKININRSDEIGKLADGINQMCNKLKTSRQEMESKIEKRTKELKELRDSLEKEVELRTKELKKKVEELEEFNELAVGREIRMVELKEEIEKIKKNKTI